MLTPQGARPPWSSRLCRGGIKLARTSVHSVPPVRNKMHKAFPLPVMEFPLPVKKVPTARRKEMPLLLRFALLLKSRSNCQSKTQSQGSTVIRITLNPHPFHSQSLHQEMDQQNPTLAKIPILDTGKFEQWQFRIQQYLQHEHYTLWEVIEFGDSYEVPRDVATTGSASDGTSKKKGRTVTLTTGDMQKRKNDVKARTTLLLSLPDEHQLRFTEGSETLEQTFNRLQVIVSQLEFMDIEIEQDDLNEKFLTSLAPEWLMHTIVWRNMSDLDTMSLDDLYNHLKVYESKVQKKSESNSQIWPLSLQQNTAAEIKKLTLLVFSLLALMFPLLDINQIDEDGMEEMDIKLNMALLSMRADRFWKKTGKKISIQGTDVAGFDKSNVESFNCHKMGHFPREYRAPRSQDRERRDNYRQVSKVKEQAPKALMAIGRVGCDWSYMANDDENHALVADEEAPSEFPLMAKTSAESVVFDNSLCSKDCKKNSDSLNRLPEFADDTITDYSRPAPTIESSPDDAQNRNPYVTKIGASPSIISPKPFIKFVKATVRSTETKTAKVETTKPVVKYAAMYSKPSKSSNVRGNQRNWNNLKSHQLGPNFVMKKKACFNCGDFNHLAYDCSNRVKKETSRSQNNTHKSFTPRPTIHKPYRPPMRPIRPNMNVAQPKRTSFHKLAHSYNKRPVQRTSAVRSKYRAPWVPTVNRNFPSVNRKFSTVNRKFPSAKKKFPTGSTKFSTADIGKKGNAVKASTCWIWKPRQNTTNKGPNSNSVSVMFKKYTYIDTQGRLNGCSRHMTGNISYISDYEPFDGGYVSFGQGGCKITGKGTIKTGTSSDGIGRKKRRTVTLTVDDMRKRKNDVKVRTTLLLSLPDEHQLRLSKYKTVQELWAEILKTFSAEGSETLEQTFNKLQVIISQLQFMDIEIKQDDLNQKFLTSLAPEWLMHMIVWRNRSDLDTMSLDDLYNHLKKKSELNSQNMAFISSAKHSRGNEEVNTASVSTTSTNVSTASANIGVASISQDIACAYIASQSSGDILKKFGFSDVRSSNTPMDKENHWGKDRPGKDVELHHYRSMIGSLMYLTASRPDIMFAICACARHQVTPKEKSNQLTPVEKDNSILDKRLEAHNLVPRLNRELLLNASCKIVVRNKMHKAFPLPVKTSYCQKKFPLLVKKVSPAEEKQCHCSPKDDVTTASASDGTGKKKGRTVTLTTDDMQKRKTDVKARTTLLLALPDEHQLCFSKHKTTQELWDAILKTFGGNEATKKTKKNLLNQQYGNFKAKGSETLEQMFNRLQVIVSHLEFMDIQIEQDDLNQKFLTSLALEWLMHTINMAFISSAKHSSGNEEVNAVSVSITSTNVSTASANIGAASISQDTACAYIASQSSGSQIKFKDINQINEKDMEEMDIKWNMALLSTRADRFWKKTRKKITIQGTDVARFDKSKVECFNCHKMGHFVRECRAPRSQDRGRRDNNKQGSKVKEQAPKALMEIDEVG
nr:hypothetical protein [Tanacetum cinerariifolium]